MATVTDPYYGVLTLQLESAITLSLNPTCVPAMPCATPFLDTSGVPSEDYTVEVYEEKSTSLTIDSAGSTSSVYALITKIVPFWEFSYHTNSCFGTMTSHLQLESVVGFDLTIGFNKGAYAVATSVELDASQGTTVEWIQTMPSRLQSFFISAYLPQFTEDFTFEALAAPTESTTVMAYPATAPATPTPYAAGFVALSAPSNFPVAYRRELRLHQEALVIGKYLEEDNRATLATVITLSFLILLGGGVIVFCWVRSIRSRSSETSGSVVTERAEINEPHSIAATMSQTSFRTEPVNFQGTFSASEASVPRHSHASAQRFELGSSISSDTSSDSDGDLVVDFNNLDDPFSDTAVISILARETTPLVSISPSQSETQHGWDEDFSRTT